MECFLIHDLDIKTLAILIGGSFALYQYSKQIKFSRLQNLSSLLHKFSENDSFLELFKDLDENNFDRIKETNFKTKLAFLALIEEVALYTELAEVDKNYAKYMFQWHFYYVYQLKDTREAFWNGIGGTDEMEEPSWDKSRKLSEQFIPEEVKKNI